MSVFSDEWRKCLREQYKYVVRNDDRVTLPSLTSILLSEAVNFTESELAQLRVEATMRVEDNPEGFVPDLDLLKDELSGDSFKPHPLECQCPACMDINLVPHDEEGQPLDNEAIAELVEEKRKKDDKNKPKQLSLF